MQWYSPGVTLQVDVRYSRNCLALSVENGRDRTSIEVREPDHDLVDIVAIWRSRREEVISYVCDGSACDIIRPFPGALS